MVRQVQMGVVRQKRFEFWTKEVTTDHWECQWPAVPSVALQFNSSCKTTMISASYGIYKKVE